MAQELPATGGSAVKMTVLSADEISKPPSTFDIISDRAFQRSTWIIAWFVVALMFWLVASIGRQAMPAVRAYGLSFLTGSTWDVNKEKFGILPAITGTMYSSVLGLMIGTAFGLAIAIFLSEGFLSSGLDSVLKAPPRRDYTFRPLPDRLATC